MGGMTANWVLCAVLRAVMSAISPSSFTGRTCAIEKDMVSVIEASVYQDIKTKKKVVGISISQHDINLPLH